MKVSSYCSHCNLDTTLQKQGLKSNRICHGSENATTICPRGLSHTLTSEFVDFCMFKFSSHSGFNLCFCHWSKRGSFIMRHHLYHEILFFEHPEVQRILLKMLNNKLPMIAENGKTAKSLLMTSLCLEQFSHSHSHRAQRSYISFKVHLNSLIYDSIMKAAVITAEWSREESTMCPGDKEWVSIYVHRSKKGKLHNYIFNACLCNNLYLFFSS